MKKKLKAVEAVPLLKLDLGCGKNKQAGFHGVDSIKFEGVDTICDLTKPWPWADSSVSDVYCSHFIEHLNGEERILGEFPGSPDERSLSCSQGLTTWGRGLATTPRLQILLEG